jgi:CheY-like chemotaxis protein
MTRLLLVDDDPVAISALRSLLELDGYQVATSISAEAAIALLAAQRFDVVVADLEMPGQDSLGILRAARSMAPPVPALAMTAISGSSDCGQATEAGACRILTKPLRYELLGQALEQVLPK